MSSKSERLLQLLLLLQGAPRTKEQLRRSVPDYADAGDEAFARMFERDKADLRDLGLEVDADRPDAADENLVTYRIDLRDQQLPPLRLTAEEAAAVAVAASLWEATAAAGVAQRAAVKVTTDAPAGTAAGVEPPRPAAGFEHIPALSAALRARQTVRFGYRRSGDAETQTRTVQPWRITGSGRAWYLVGWDVDRAAQRTFRLSRLTSSPEPIGPADAYQPPADLEPEAPTPGSIARIRVAPGAAWPLRRRGHEVGPDLIEVAYRDRDALAAELTGYGSAIVVTEPAELRAAVRDRLAAVVRR